MPARLLEPADHAVDDGGTGEDVALRGRELAALVPGPLGRFRTRVRRILALQIHHRELASLFAPVLWEWIGILVENRLDNRLRLQPFSQELEGFRSVSDVDNGLRRGDA